ncbi:hypothetical protein ABKY47_003293 [Aeromonas hydrophila]
MDAERSGLGSQQLLGLCLSLWHPFGHEKRIISGTFPPGLRLEPQTLKDVLTSWSAAKAAGKTAAFLAALWCARLRGVIGCSALYIHTVKGEM